MSKRVAILCGNSDHFIAVRDAVTAAGDVLVPINPRLARPEVAYILEHSGAAAVYADPALADKLPVGTPWTSVADVPPGPVPDAIGATLLYTSGTTGRPKGCLRTEAQEAARAAELIDTYSICADDVHIVACPLAHSAPGIFMRAGRKVGARTVVLPRFRPDEFLASVQEHRGTLFFLVPTQYERLLAMPPEARAAYDVSSVRCAIVAGAPVATETKRRIIDWLGDGVLWEFYGSSETGTVSVMPPDGHLAHPGSVGKPAPGVELEIRRGEIFVRSPTVMAGYLDMDTPFEDGFLSVGDLGRVDGAGYLYLIDRKHDTIVSGGMNVYPAEVERALKDCPGVTGGVVFGVAHPDWGEMVTAVYAGDATEDQLRDALRDRVAGYKIPKAFARVALDELPVGASGKPLRRKARALFERHRDLLR